MIDCAIPKDWHMDGPLFVGYVLCDTPESGANAVGFHQGDRGHSDAFLRFSIDLRTVHAIKRRTPEDDVTSLFGDAGLLLGVVNAPFSELFNYWSPIRSSVIPHV